mmetsp:Transcript_37335/g.45012  ORF Transcript_37335/g.45012 Transcript_37335/m.45012 type:complete len:83 (+) Transcript_37335:662-910(+)
MPRLSATALDGLMTELAFPRYGDRERELALERPPRRDTVEFCRVGVGKGCSEALFPTDLFAHWVSGEVRPLDERSLGCEGGK